MSLQSTQGVPPPPLIPGGMSVASVQVNRSTKLFGTLVVPSFATTGEMNTPVEGALIFQDTAKDLMFYDGTTWQTVATV